MSNPAAGIRARAQAQWVGAPIVERSRNHIKHQNPLNPKQFMLDLSVGPLHIAGTETEIDTAWIDADPVLDAPWQKKMVLADYHAFAFPGNDTFDSGQLLKYIDPISGEDIAFQPQQLQWTNDLDQIEAIADPANISPTIDDDTIIWVDGYGAGLDFRWQTQTARLQKRLIINSLAELGSPSQFIIDGGNPMLKLSFIFQKSAGVEIWIDGVEWNENPNNPQTTGSNVEFRLSDQSVLWYLRTPWVSDEDNNPLNAMLPLPVVTQKYHKQGPNLLIDILVPWSWLETAVYPVIIDPSTEPQVAGSDDDAHEAGGGAQFSSISWLNVTSHTSAGARWHSGAYFPSIGIAAVDTIDDAYALVFATGTSVDSVNVDLGMEDVDSGVDFATNGDVTTRIASITTAVTQWTEANIGTAEKQSLSFTASVQEIIDRPGWASGQNMVFLIEGRSDSVSAARLESYDTTSSEAIKLHITYTAGGVAADPIGFMAGVLKRRRLNPLLVR